MPAGVVTNAGCSIIWAIIAVKSRRHIIVKLMEGKKEPRTDQTALFRLGFCEVCMLKTAVRIKGSLSQEMVQQDAP